MNLNLLNNNSSPNQIFNNVVNNPNISIDDFRAMTLAVNNKTPLNSFFTNTGNERTKEGIHSEIKKSNLNNFTHYNFYKRYQTSINFIKLL